MQQGRQASSLQSHCNGVMLRIVAVCVAAGIAAVAAAAAWCVFVEALSIG
jgi:hypothetical protein